MTSIRNQADNSELPSGRRRPSSDVLAQDLASLNRLRSSFEAFANKCVAQCDRVDRPSRAPGFSEIDCVLEEICALFIKYRALLTGDDSSKIGPEITWD